LKAVVWRTASVSPPCHYWPESIVFSIARPSNSVRWAEVGVVEAVDVLAGFDENNWQHVNIVYSPSAFTDSEACLYRPVPPDWR